MNRNSHAGGNEFASTAGVRLDSWKEIARYLGRYERTVQLWEKERGLPIHRPPGIKRGGVYAFTAELDAWLAQTSDLEGEDLASADGGEESEAASGSAPGPLDELSGKRKASEKRAAVWYWGALAVLLFAACLAGAYYLGHKNALSATVGAGNSVQVRALTFRRGYIRSARFRPDGGNVVYGAAWEGSPVALFETSLDRPESSPLRASSAQLLAVSRSSTLAVLLNARALGPYMQVGTLAVQGLYEDNPQQLSTNVGWADWSPDGSTLVYTVINKNGASWVESYSLDGHLTRRVYPTGNSVPNEWYSHVRYSRDGKLLAFEVHHGTGSGGHALLFDPARGSSITSEDYANISGAAWAPDGKSIWFTAAEKGYSRGIHALDLAGHTRLVYQAPIALTLQDISSNGDVLVTRDFAYSALFAQPSKAATRETELSLFDWSVLGDISADGKTVALIESGEAVQKPGVYLRSTSGGEAKWLGEAHQPVSLSPGGNSVVALSGEACPKAVLLTSNRRSEVLTGDNLCVGLAFWAPDGRHVILDGVESQHKGRCYLADVSSKQLQPITAEGSRCYLVSPDGNTLLAQSDGEFYKVALSGNHASVKTKFNPSYTPLRWLAGDQIITDDGKTQGIATYDLATGALSLKKSIDLPAGVESIAEIRAGSDPHVYAFSGYRMRSDLCLIHNLR